MHPLSNPYDNKRRLYEDALNVHNATNMRGVVHSFAQLLDALPAHLKAEGKPCGTQDVASHPATVLFARAIARLAGYQMGGGMTGLRTDTAEAACDNALARLNATGVP